ncbi:hypothetical protein C8R45DRAFT_990241 [Mycena sanguinolenta]|nr:hypothetical protein C8R45DRAFT_990241 [Mycena sanguinolenta]
MPPIIPILRQYPPGETAYLHICSFCLVRGFNAQKMDSFSIIHDFDNISALLEENIVFWWLMLRCMYIVSVPRHTSLARSGRARSSDAAYALHSSSGWCSRDARVRLFGMRSSARGYVLSVAKTVQCRWTEVSRCIGASRTAATTLIVGRLYLGKLWWNPGHTGFAQRTLGDCRVQNLRAACCVRPETLLRPRVSIRRACEQLGCARTDGTIPQLQTMTPIGLQAGAGCCRPADSRAAFPGSAAQLLTISCIQDSGCATAAIAGCACPDALDPIRAMQLALMACRIRH